MHTHTNNTCINTHITHTQRRKCVLLRVKQETETQWDRYRDRERQVTEIQGDRSRDRDRGTEAGDRCWRPGEKQRWGDKESQRGK